MFRKQDIWYALPLSLNTYFWEKSMQGEQVKPVCQGSAASLCSVGLYSVDSTTILVIVIWAISFPQQPTAGKHAIVCQKMKPS
jgi:hypothetical protein